MPRKGRPRLPVDTALLRRLHAQGRFDGEIASALRVSKDTAARRRQEMGLPAHRRSPRFHARVRRGLARGYARSYGLPEGLPGRAVQVLLALVAAGMPQTKEALASLCGASWRGKNTLREALAALVQQGLVSRLDRSAGDAGRLGSLYFPTGHALEVLAHAGERGGD